MRCRNCIKYFGGGLVSNTCFSNLEFCSVFYLALYESVFLFVFLHSGAITEEQCLVLYHLYLFMSYTFSLHPHGIL